MGKRNSERWYPRVATYQDCLRDPELLRRIGMTRKEVKKKIAEQKARLELRRIAQLSLR